MGNAIGKMNIFRSVARDYAQKKRNVVLSRIIFFFEKRYVGRLSKMSLKLKIKEFEIAFQQLSNTEKVFDSYFFIPGDKINFLKKL